MGLAARENERERERVRRREREEIRDWITLPPYVARQIAPTRCNESRPGIAIS